MSQTSELQKKPLVEAILEVKWELEQLTTGRVGEPKYDLLIGSFFQRIKDRFPEHIKLPLAQVPSEMVPHKVQHQFRRAPDMWPLLQLGPGIITINDTEAYKWQDFSALCVYAMSALTEAYPGQRPRITDVLLRYIDADSLDALTPVEFLSKLKVHVQVPESISKDQVVAGAADSVGFSISYPVSKPQGVAALVFNSGERDRKPALIWETAVRSLGESAHSFDREPEGWLADAHAITHNWFFSLIEGELHDKYK